MDHAEALELIETAAAEPGGLDRLMAGDTPDAAALAGHLAACSSCADALVRMRRTATVVRDIVASGPAPELRARTLAYVREMGRPRGAPAPATIPVSAVRSDGERQGPRPGTGRRRVALPLAWGASIAATAIVAAGLAGAVLQPAAVVDPAAQALARVTVATLRVEGEPDAERVALVGTSGASTAGTLVFSPATGELVVVATDLAEPPAGAEYRCWVETGDGRRRVGKMFFGGGIAYWVGPVEGLDALGDGARFGVSLADGASNGVDTEPVLVGEL